MVRCCPRTALLATTVLLASIGPDCEAQPGVWRYLELPGVRCEEVVGVHPLGSVGQPWTDELLATAEALCDVDAECLGVMRYIGTLEAHCNDWCGRPQFCAASGVSEGGLSLNSAWASFIKVERLAELGLGLRGTPHDLFWTWPTSGGPSGEVAAPLRRGELLRPLACGDEVLAEPWRGPAVVLLSSLLRPADARRLFPEACLVAHRPFGAPDPEDGAVGGLDGVITEVEDKELPVFSAALRRRVGDEASLPTWRYHFDAAHEFPVPLLGPAGSKRHILSAYFLTRDSTCEGPKGEPLSVEDVVAALSPEHVHVEDGTHKTREAAFKHYRFTLFCGNFTDQPFPPQALVYSIAYVAYALVPEFVHWKGSRLFFHMPDAAQGYRTMDVANLEPYLEDMVNNPAKEKIAEFKETFALLVQQLLWYRYREPARRRAEVAACLLCDGRQRELRRQAAASAAAAAAPAASAPALGSQGAGASGFPAVAYAVSAAGGGAGGPGAAAVAVVFCAMSRRGAHGLRSVVRETWGRAIAEAHPGAAQRFFVGRGEAVQEDVGLGDVIELPVPESYRTLNLKALTLLSWTFHAFPNLQWIVRHDDDVYLRAGALMAQLAARPPVRYYWGMFDHGSAPVRDPEHQHYNSYEQFPKQQHPAWGDIFPPYARGILWAMSADLMGLLVADFLEEISAQPGAVLDERAANSMPHPDDPAVGVLVTSLVRRGISVNLDDRDLNSYSLNPACNSTFSNIHNRTWIVHHVKPETMRCMWNLDTAEGAFGVADGNSAIDASKRLFPDLCLCSEEVEEEAFEDDEEEPFWYDKTRFNNAR
mmetsp:Transcript_168515/g.535902  ORF Transcript_168515/g.535902 Transcript_168515/m.535902 type:complete len:819 (-) Transcript_168515:69-2525(-)